MLENIVKILKSDVELISFQLVFAGLKSAACLDFNYDDYSELDFKSSLFYKIQDNCNAQIYWYFFKYKKRLVVYVVDRDACKKYDYLFLNEVFKKDIEESCCEQMIMKELWKDNAMQYGVCLGYPLSVAKEFHKEMINNCFRNDRVKDMFLHTKKDCIGFISYPEYLDDSLEKMLIWKNYVKLLGVTTVTRKEWDNNRKK